MSAHEAAPDEAPGALHRIEELVNTFSVETDTESLTDPAGLAAWLTERGLLPPDAARAVGEADLVRARTVREGLRAMMLRNNPADPEDSTAAHTALAEFAAAARELPLVLDPSATPPALTPHARDTVDAALATLLADVAASVADGTWARMKGCRECHWGYYDHSRNRSRAWCSMALCGNRAKARAFRSRGR